MYKRTAVFKSGEIIALSHTLLTLPTVTVSMEAAPSKLQTCGDEREGGKKGVGEFDRVWCQHVCCNLLVACVLASRVKY